MSSRRAVYGISKGGLIQMTRMLAIEWIPHNIRVNAVSPAPSSGPNAVPRAKMYDDATRARVVARIPIGRSITRKREVAAAVVFLASPGGALGDHRSPSDSGSCGELRAGFVACATKYSP